ncbi:unnamed protein product [Chrysoparadoxa australica]
MLPTHTPRSSNSEGLVHAFLLWLRRVWAFLLRFWSRLKDMGSAQRATLSAGTSITYSSQSIAEGGFSFVHKATNTRTGRTYALKKILCQSEEQKRSALNEIKRHRDLHHPNLMPLIDSDMCAQVNGTMALLLFPFADGGSLREMINWRVLGLGGGMGESEALRLFEGVCRGVAALHTQIPPLVHRDIKPENVLLMKDSSSPSEALIPVLTDFGSMGAADVVVTCRAEALKVQDEAAQFCSMAYRAPELFDVASDAVLGAATDVWSLGCLLYAIAFGFSPFESEFTSEGVVRVVECSFLRVIGPVAWPPANAPVYQSRGDYSTGFRELVAAVLQQSPEKRPTVGTVLEWVRSLQQQ